MTHPTFLTFDNKQVLAGELAYQVADVLRHGIERHGRATLVVSGGNTPVPFFHALRDQPIDWPKLTILLADERWVPITDADSSEKLVREHLLSDGATLFSLAPLEGESVEDGAARLNATLQDLTQPMDVAILGMGDDAHTASLFPGHAALGQGLDKDGEALCLPVTDSPKPPPERVTLTAALLCRARHLILHITGESKKTAYEEAMHSDNPVHFPIASILKQSDSKPTVYWAA